MIPCSYGTCLELLHLLQPLLASPLRGCVLAARECAAIDYIPPEVRLSQELTKAKRLTS